MVKQLFYIKDSERELPAQQVLSVQLGTKHCCLALTNKDGDQLFKLFYYGVSEFDPNPLPNIFEQNEWLKNPFYQVLISYDYPQNVLTPAAFYKPDEGARLLKGIYAVNGSSAIIAESVDDWQLHNIYAVPKEVHEYLVRHFTGAKYWHKFSIQLKGIEKANDNEVLLVDFKTDEFTVLAVAEGKVLLTQTFCYTSPEDVLYHLLKICSTLNLSQERLLLSLSGLIDQRSNLYNELYNYFIHPEFRTARWRTGEEHPSHFFTTLNDLARCAS